MDPQSMDEMINYILALKQNNAQTLQTLQAQIKNLQDELKNVKITSKPLKK